MAKILFVGGFFHELPHKLLIVFNHYCIISLPENISLAAALCIRCGVKYTALPFDFLRKWLKIINLWHK
jgi:hypothetical protein